MSDTVKNLAEAREWVTLALDQLQSHCESLRDSASWAEIRAICHAGQGRLEVWWRGTRSALGEALLWDRAAVLEADSEGMAALLDAQPTKPGLRVVAGSESPLPAAIPRQEPPMFAYHPQRLRTLLPIGREVARLGLYGRGPVGIYTEDEVYALNMLLQQHMVARPGQLLTQGVRKRIFGNEEAGAHQAVSEVYFQFMWFERAGRNIFDIPPLMTEMFQRTDIDDLPASELKMPYQSVYVALHPQENLQLREGWFIDGAYVTRGDDGSLHIGFTARPPSVDAFVEFHTSIEPVHTQYIAAKYMNMTLGQAVTHALSDELQHIEKRLVKEVPSEVQALLTERGMELKNTSGDEISEQRKELMQRQAVYEQALRLVINSLMYLTSYPDDVESRWPDGTPHRLVEQATAPGQKEKQRRNAASKLMALGFTAIHLCGRKFREEAGAKAERTAGRVRVDSGDERTTWVKGCWTPQAHGPKWSLRKWLWRKPHKRVLHGSGPESDDGVGHLYMVT